MEGFSNVTFPEGGGNFCIIVYIFLYFTNSKSGEPKDLKPKEKDLRCRGLGMFLFFLYVYLQKK